MCCLCPDVVAQPLFHSIQSFAMALFDYCEQSLVPLLVPVWVHLGLELSQTRICQRCSSTELQGSFPVLSTEKLSLVGRACNQTKCLPPVNCCGHSLTGMWLSSPLP